MMLTFCTELWHQCRDEVLALGPEHYGEVSQFREAVASRPAIPYSIDLGKLARLEALGMLHVVVGRDTGRVVAYHVSVVERAMHYDLLAAKGDVYFVCKPYRFGRNVLRFWEFVHESLRRRGVPQLYDSTKLDTPANDHGRLFEHLGYTLVEKVYSKWLGTAEAS